MPLAHWILLDPAGKVRAQVITNGQTPTKVGRNPAGMTEVQVERQGDLLGEEWVDGKWKPRLDTARALRWKDVKRRRAELLGVASVIEVAPYGRIQADPASVDLILTHLRRAARSKGEYKTRFRLADNSYAEVTAADLEVILAAIDDHVVTVMEASFSAYDQLGRLKTATGIHAAHLGIFK